MQRFILAFVVVIAAVGVAFAATDAFRASAAQCQPKVRSNKPPVVGDAPWDALSVSYNRNSGLLRSLSVRARPETANACTEVEIWGAAPGQSWQPVFREQVSMPPVAAWSGTIRTRDWSGGCRATWRYTIVALSVGPGTALPNVASTSPVHWGNNRQAEVDGERLNGCGRP